MDDYDIPFDGMSEDEFLYRAMNEDDPMYMGPTDDDVFYDDDEIDIDQLDDWDQVTMKRNISEKEAKLRHQRKVDAVWGISIIFLIFGLTAYFALRDDDTAPKDNSVPTTISSSIVSDTVKTVNDTTNYSEFYHIGYEKGYAAGEEDTNDGDYMAGYDDSNNYSGKNAEDYCLGYNHGYEDAYEEMAEHNENEEPL